ncbi:MAG: DUF6048 family protein [Reichenbachiella sp.]
MRIYRYIFSVILLVCGGVSAQAQYEKREKDWKPSELFLSADVIGLTRLISNDLQGEFQAKVDFDRFYLVGDLGLSKLSSTGDGFDYESEGNFFRVGPQINLMPYNRLRSNIYFGLMYGHAEFSDEIEYQKSAGNWPDANLSISNDKMKSNWFEMNLGLNARVYKNFYMGYVVRLKFAQNLSGAEVLYPYEIPGFGKGNSTTVFGFNYYITYRIPFRDKPIPVKPKRIVEKNPE